MWFVEYIKQNVVTVLILLPLIGACLVSFAPDVNKKSQDKIRWIALITTIVILFLSLFVWSNFNVNGGGGSQFTVNNSWLEQIGVSYFVGIDGISIGFLLLTTILFPLFILGSWNSIFKDVKRYMIAFLILEATVIGAFVSLDIVLFYMFFEASLIPMYYIVGIWGGEKRVYASYKLMIYTIAGSILMLLAIIMLIVQSGSANINIIISMNENFYMKEFIWGAMFVGFAVKVPMWPFHSWLPDVHVQAPTSGSMALAGILLKFGVFGLVKFLIPIFPQLSFNMSGFVYFLSIIGVVYASALAFVQTDMKKVIAYSSIAHMAYVTAAVFTFNIQALSGVIFQSISHGVVSSALFLCIGILYFQNHSRNMADYGGVAAIAPKFSVLFLLFVMASIGLPSTSGFVGEFLILQGVFEKSFISAIFIALGVVFGAVYMLNLYKLTMLGTTNFKLLNMVEKQEFKDISSFRQEYIALIVLAFMVILLGIYPSIITKYFDSDVNVLINFLNSRLKLGV